MKTCLSCLFLQGGLTLWPNGHMTPCCLGIYNDLKASKLSMPSNTDLFDIDAWQRLMDEAHVGLAQGVVPPECQGCPQLRELPQSGPVTPLFISVNIINSRKCNLACNFCYLQKEFRTVDQAFDPHLGMFHDLVTKGLIGVGTTIFWGGGEPALHPNLKELYSLFISAGCRQHFDTNATVYMDFLENDLASGHTTLSCSLMSAIPETYKQVMGRNLCEQAWQNAKRYAATGGDVRAKFIILPENSNQEEIFVTKCKAYGISIINLDREIYTMNANCEDERNILRRAVIFTRAAASHGIDILNGVSLAYSRQNFLHEMYRHIEKEEKRFRELKNTKKSHITISQRGKNKDSLAEQVFFLGVQSDIAPVVDMRHLNITGHTKWSTGKYSYFSKQYYYVTDSSGSQLSFDVYYRDKLALRFISHEWSGIISICIDEKEDFIIDLYSKDHKHVEFDVLKKNISFYKRFF